MNSLYTKAGLKGIGVYTSQDILGGEIIEVCPVLVIPNTDPIYGVYVAEGAGNNQNDSVLDNYYYSWSLYDQEAAAIALGMGSLFNHSYEPNSIYIRDYERNTLTIKAIKDINAHEEITINYNGTPADRSPVWFDVIS